jgi:VIT1/CCC1 family predicted Fe2+/Mn2+ transporter/rubrerythrin
MAPPGSEQKLENLKLERDAIWLYDHLAAVEKDEGRAGAFRMIAANERRHAAVWEAALSALGVSVPPPGGPRLRVRTIAFLARLLGTNAVAELVTALEGNEERNYASQPSAETAALAADERAHAEIWRQLKSPAAAGVTVRVHLGAEAEAVGIANAAAISAPGQIALGEKWHVTGRSGSFRAIVFGVSDGLVSNLALVMGVAGAASSEPGFILLAGIAGLLAGAFSMAAGEYISMQSQRELFERQIALERAEMEAMPEEELAELAAIYRAKGFEAHEARAIAERLWSDPDMALKTLVREELGLDPDELGSPWGAAIGSFVAFCAGAAVPVIPYFLGGGPVAFWTSLGLSLAALFGVGVGVSLLTGRGALYSGTRQMLLGLGAAAVTYAVGTIIGVGVA